MTDPARNATSDTAVDPEVFVLQRVGDRVAVDWLLGLPHDGRLATWSIPGERAPRRVAPQLATRQPDRPVAAGFHEGPRPADPSVTDVVTVADRGPVRVVSWGNDEVVVDLAGCRMRGRYRLGHTASGQWEFRRVGDVEAGVGGPSEDTPAMMVAEQVGLDDDVNWAFEPCWSGLRAGYGRRGARVTLRDVDGVDRLEALPELADLATAVEAERLLLDGVVVVLDVRRRPDRAVLEERLAGRSDAPVVYVAFDLLRVGAEDLDVLPLWYRRERLEELGLSGAHWLTTPQWTDTSLPAAIEAATSHGMAGIVAKRRGSPYLASQPGAPWRRITA